MGAPPSCVTMFTTPATAFDPYSEEAEPRSTSMWSGATMLNVDMKELESPCVVVASRKRRPSTRTAAASVRKPRIRMLVFWPGPPPLVTTTPGTVRSVSLSAYSSRLRISSAETTLMAFEISSNF